MSAGSTAAAAGGLSSDSVERLRRAVLTPSFWPWRFGLIDEAPGGGGKDDDVDLDFDFVNVVVALVELEL